MEHIIDVKHLKKSYGHQEAIRDVSFYVNKGQMVAILGPNGAGKSSTINILCTLLPKDSGEVTIDGYQLGRQNDQIRKKIGVVFQNGVLDDRLTIAENLSVRGRFYQIGQNKLKTEIDRISELTGIVDLLNKQYGNLSGGQKRRCDIARALLPSPSILFLDEPATGLDPQMRSIVWQTIDLIQRERNTSIILTTHYMEEAAKADHVFMIKNGTILTSGSPYDLKSRYSKDHMVLYGKNTQSLVRLLEHKNIKCHSYENGIELELKDTLEAIPILEQCRGKYSGFEVIKGSMEDAYLSIVERG